MARSMETQAGWGMDLVWPVITASGRNASTTRRMATGFGCSVPIRCGQWPSVGERWSRGNSVRRMWRGRDCDYPPMGLACLAWSSGLRRISTGSPVLGLQTLSPRTLPYQTVRLPSRKVVHADRCENAARSVTSAEKRQNKETPESLCPSFRTMIIETAVDITLAPHTTTQTH
jgi:hypothetical protein